MNELPDELKGKWTAYYMPASDRPSPSKYDFESEEAAEQYIFSRMCLECREGRQRVLDGISDPDNNEEHLFDSLWPGCACEWGVMRTEEYFDAETPLDLLEAAGWKTIWTKEDGDVSTKVQRPDEDRRLRLWSFLGEAPSWCSNAPRVRGSDEGSVHPTGVRRVWF